MRQKMDCKFPEIITALRRERGISQKQVSADLGISQALLSHYEKGIRECGLDFLIRTAEYYGVSCDYLLGRTSCRQPDTGEAGSDDTDAPGLINKRQIVQALRAVIHLLEQVGSSALSEEGAAFLSLAFYRLLRTLCSLYYPGTEQLFRLDSSVYIPLAVGQMQFCEARMSVASSGVKKQPPITPALLLQKYPVEAPALLELVEFAEDRLDKLYRSSTELKT